MSAVAPRWLPPAMLAVLVAASGCDSADRAHTESRAELAPGGTAAPRAFPAGRWQGRLAQRGRLPFGVSVTLRAPGEGPSTVRYNGIDCSGRWRFLGRRGEDFRFRELIEERAGEGCGVTGMVTLRYISRDRMRYELRGGGAPISGFLRRQGPIAAPPPA